MPNKYAYFEGLPQICNFKFGLFGLISRILDFSRIFAILKLIEYFG